MEINGLQRMFTVTVQTSAQEGFGLTVTEGLWKEKPVVDGAVGGIPTQVIHKLTGVLVHSVEGCAYQIRYLLTHPEFAAHFFFQAEDGIRDHCVTGVQTCALPICHQDDDDLEHH